MIFYAPSAVCDGVWCTEELSTSSSMCLCVSIPSWQLLSWSMNMLYASTCSSIRSSMMSTGFGNGGRCRVELSTSSSMEVRCPVSYWEPLSWRLKFVFISVNDRREANELICCGTAECQKTLAPCNLHFLENRFAVSELSALLQLVVAVRHSCVRICSNTIHMCACGCALHLAVAVRQSCG